MWWIGRDLHPQPPGSVSRSRRNQSGALLLELPTQNKCIIMRRVCQRHNSDLFVNYTLYKPSSSRYGTARRRKDLNLFELTAHFRGEDMARGSSRRNLAGRLSSSTRGSVYSSGGSITMSKSYVKVGKGIPTVTL